MDYESNDNTTEPQENTQANFRDLLPEEYKNMYPEFKKPEDFVKGYDQLVRKLGNSVSIPKEDAAAEELNKFYSKLGRPDAPEKYEFNTDNLEIDNEFLGKFKKAAYDNGISQKQAERIFGWYNEELRAETEKYTQLQQEERAKAEAELKTRFGSKYDEKIKRAQELARNIVGKDSQEKLIKYGNDPDFIQLLAEINDKYVREDRIDTTAMSAPLEKDYKEQARSLMLDPNYKFDLDKQAKVRSLYQKIAASSN